MAELIMTPFTRHPQEAAIIGRLLAGYGELEFDLGALLTNFLPHRVTAVKAMFRVRSESGRIQVADALIRDPLRELGLEPQYADMLGGFRHCLKIRNQYAHCHWNDELTEPKGQLKFCDLGEAAQSPGEPGLVFRTASLGLLQEQEAYFRYTQKCLWFLDAEAENRLRGPKPHSLQMPPKTAQPPLHNP